ncbi:hypothetical protein [Pseudoalteromonas denitrificans]|uniref:Secreted protein n=1 Tax=Pseudoalteromonas denitrificans DSM 6059 TaxID=1123010 RepID=A0A1I1M7J5_9GAMM|nr:hypothetical protein [Pseudoalteromonas denitrificans]SFC81487.1 hypothetical protein SAMN02745724_02603 [Pseudoalteromonas denitrificans DSM 6059]
MKKNLFTTLLLTSQFAVAGSPAPVSINTQDQFFNALSQHCGKAFLGKVTVGGSDNDSFSKNELIMHVRHCNKTQIQIPFHVGADASRTWLITKTGSGLSLKHDHRHKNGLPDESTMYGGHTNTAGWAQAQSFPADQYSKELFIKTGIPQSIGNTWHMYIYPKKFTYRLTREGREFNVDFDLTKSITPPPAPWGYKD